MSNPDKKIPLVELFGPTIQGEGAVIGQQTYFLRFGLCDYKCKMCDSMNAVDPLQVKANAEWLPAVDIAERLIAFASPTSTRWVTFSGGNPCIHDLIDVCHRLKASDRWRIAVETQGTFAPDWLQMVDIITVSPKGPGMGENTDLAILDKFMGCVEPWMHTVNFKIVVFDQRDLEFAKMMFERYGHHHIPFYLSLGNPYPPKINAKPDLWSLDRDPGPDWPTHVATLVGAYKQLFEDIKDDPILSQMRFLPQWHVLVWGNQKGK